MGVGLTVCPTYSVTSRFPHNRGGGPLAEVDIEKAGRVFPTMVGVGLEFDDLLSDSYSFPHDGGGGPGCPRLHGVCAWFSPHAWGWAWSKWARIER